MAADSYINATPEEIGDWVKQVRLAIDAGITDYSVWYLTFFKDIEQQYSQWISSEAPGFPLSPKQTTYLSIMVNHLAAEVIRHTKSRELDIDRLED